MGPPGSAVDADAQKSKHPAARVLEQKVRDDTHSQAFNRVRPYLDYFGIVLKTHICQCALTLFQVCRCVVCACVCYVSFCVCVCYVFFCVCVRVSLCLCVCVFYIILCTL